MSKKLLNIVVTDHAMWRAKERFPDFDTVLIESEVRGALVTKNYGKRRPLTIYGRNGGDDSPNLYAWNGERVYLLKPGDDALVVVTVLPYEEAA